MNKVLILGLLLALASVVLGEKRTYEEKMRVLNLPGRKQTRDGAKKRKSHMKRKGRKVKRNKKKGNNKSERKLNKTGEKKLFNSTKRDGTCATNTTCLENAVSYLKLMKDTVTNFYKQANRINASSRIGAKKGGKKGQFAPTLRRLLEAGGRNKTDLRCNGVSKSSGSRKLTDLTATLENCETKINMSCNTGNFPLPNMSQVSPPATWPRWPPAWPPWPPSSPWPRAA